MSQQITKQEAINYLNDCIDSGIVFDTVFYKEPVTRAQVINFLQEEILPDLRSSLSPRCNTNYKNTCLLVLALYNGGFVDISLLEEGVELLDFNTYSCEM